MAKTRKIKESNRITYVNDEYIVLKSYDTFIASIDRQTGALSVGDAWYYSRTTWDHFRKFLRKYITFLSDPLAYTLEGMLDKPQQFHGPTVIRTLIAVDIIEPVSYNELYKQAWAKQ